MSDQDLIAAVLLAIPGVTTTASGIGGFLASDNIEQLPAKALTIASSLALTAIGSICLYGAGRRLYHDHLSNNQR